MAFHQQPEFKVLLNLCTVPTLKVCIFLYKRFQKGNQGERLAVYFKDCGCQIVKFWMLQTGFFKSCSSYFTHCCFSTKCIRENKIKKAFTVLIKFDCLNQSSARTQSKSPLKDCFQFFTFIFLGRIPTLQNWPSFNHGFFITDLKPLVHTKPECFYFFWDCKSKKLSVSTYLTVSH